MEDRTPVLIGVGQVVIHGNATGEVPYPQGLRAAAARRALVDTGAGQAFRRTIDTVAVVRTMADSIPGFPQPFGRSSNPPGALVAALGIAPQRSIYSAVGGDQPQALVNEAATAIFAGEAECVLLAGAEATAAFKVAQRAGVALDWSDPDAPSMAMEDRGFGAPLLSPYELANGLGAPVRTYPLFEQALRARRGLNRDAYREVMSELWTGFSRVAAANPCAQFPVERSVDFLSTVSPENYPVADPYLKWDVAQDAVNQGAALILTSVGKAAELGIDPAKWVYLHGAAEASDAFVSERPDLARSRPIEWALSEALSAAGLAAEDIDHYDLYSCFPCAVLLAAEALGLDWRARALTVTGGLPFFGAAGNNYSMHAIATMAERLRAAPGSFGLVLANGGFLSKQAVGIYSAKPADWQPVTDRAFASEVAVVDQDCAASVESYTVIWNKGVPEAATIVGTVSPGIRIIGRTKDAALIDALRARDPIGRPARFTSADGRNTLAALD